MKRAKSRTIYSDDYYRMEKFVSEPVFQERVSWLRAEYEKHGIPLPAHGFRTYDGYMAWIDKFWKCLTATEALGEVRDRITAVSSGPTMTSEQYNRVEQIRSEMLPPVPGQFQRDLLEEFGYNPKNEKLKNFLTGYIFLGKKHLNEKSISVRWKRDEKTEEWELSMVIFPHTKRADVHEFWGEVVKAQKMAPNYVGKSKRWETFERDLEIHKTWQHIADGKERRHGRKTWIDAASLPVDHSVFMELHKKYPRLTLVQIRKAVSRIGQLEQGQNG